jgi:hypothetical protein
MLLRCAVQTSAREKHAVGKGRVLLSRLLGSTSTSAAVPSAPSLPVRSLAAAYVHEERAYHRQLAGDTWLDLASGSYGPARNQLSALSELTQRLETRTAVDAVGPYEIRKSSSASDATFERMELVDGGTRSGHEEPWSEFFRLGEVLERFMPGRADASATLEQMTISRDGEWLAARVALHGAGEDMGDHELAMCVVKDLRRGQWAWGHTVDSCVAVRWLDYPGAWPARGLSTHPPPLVYTTVDEDGWRPSRVWLRTADLEQGGAPKDALVFEDADPAHLVDVSVSKDGAALFIQSLGLTDSEVWVADASRADGALSDLRVVLPRREHMKYSCER